MIADLLQLLAANACFLAAGLGVLRLAGRRVGGLAGVGLAYVAGVAAVGVAATLLLVAGSGLSVVELVALCAVLFAAGLAVRRPGEPAEGSVPGPRWVAPAGAALVALFFAFLLPDLVFQPLSAWDAWQHWGAKARALVVLDGLDASLLDAPAYLPWHPDYPLLVPALEAVAFRFMGINTQLVHVQFGLLLAGFALALVRLLRASVPPVLLWPLLAAAVWAPSVGFQTASAYADVPLGIFLALAAVCAWRWLATERRADLALFALFGAAGLATKMEGQVYVGALAFALVVLAARRSRRHAGLALVAAGAALVGIVPWRVWTLLHGIEGTYSTETGLSAATSAASLERLDRLPLAARALATEALDPQAWLVVVPVAALAWALAWRRERRDDGVLLVAATAALSFVGLLAVYWLTPYDLEWHLDHSASRVVAPFVLLCAACAPLLLARAAGQRRGAP